MLPCAVWLVVRKRFFFDCGVVEAKEPSPHPVRVEHVLTTPIDPVAAVVDRVLELHLTDGEPGHAHDRDAAILAFLPSPRDAELAAMKLQEQLWSAVRQAARAAGEGREGTRIARAAGMRPCSVTVCHEEMSGAELARACDAAVEGRKIIMTTQVAESAWIIPDVAIVVDAGVVTQLRHRAPWPVDTQVVGESGSCSLCVLRCGSRRCADRISAPAHDRRTLCAASRPNAKHYCLYTKQVCGWLAAVLCCCPSFVVALTWLVVGGSQDLDEAPADDEPSVQRMSCGWMLLQVKALAPNYTRLFRMFNDPPGASFGRGLSRLQQLGALDLPGDITVKGKKMAALGLEPMAAAAVLEVSARDA